MKLANTNTTVTKDKDSFSESEAIHKHSVLPIGRLLAEEIVLPASVEMATWPSACTVKGVPACDDF